MDIDEKELINGGLDVIINNMILQVQKEIKQDNPWEFAKQDVLDYIVSNIPTLEQIKSKMPNLLELYEEVMQRLSDYDNEDLSGEIGDGMVVSSSSKSVKKALRAIEDLLDTNLDYIQVYKNIHKKIANKSPKQNIKKLINLDDVELKVKCTKTSYNIYKIADNKSSKISKKNIDYEKLQPLIQNSIKSCQKKLKKKYKVHITKIMKDSSAHQYILSCFDETISSVGDKWSKIMFKHFMDQKLSNEQLNKKLRTLLLKTYKNCMVENLCIKDKNKMCKISKKVEE
jgi:Trp operon repressor